MCDTDLESRVSEPSVKVERRDVREREGGRKEGRAEMQGRKGLLGDQNVRLPL